MRIFQKPLIILFAILVLAGFLRTYDLGITPLSLNWDEVALGYNAKSILTTGRDEYGAFLPVVLRSYDDYKPALYAYLDIPFVAILGLTEQAVRLPSSIAGVIAVALVYFLVRLLLGTKKISIGEVEIKSEYVALLVSLLLSISPWHIQFSRIAFESNVGLTINIAVFLFFLKGLKKPAYLPFAFGLAALNLHMYQSERVFSPLLVIVLSIIFIKKVIDNKKILALSIVTAVLVALPLGVYILSNNNALMRAKGVSIFAEQSIVKRSSEKLLRDEAEGNIIGKILDNRRVEYVKAVGYGYISHFDLNWLFITGDITRHHAPFMGLLYIFEFPLLLVGIYTLVFLKIDKRYKMSFFAYFLLVPVPASITSGVPHAVRTLNFAWTYELMIALGIFAIIIFVKTRKKGLLKYLFLAISGLYCVLALLNISYYFNQYFSQMNYFTAQDWLYGYKQAIKYVSVNANKYDKIVVENEIPFDQSYMFFLFYLNIDPAKYQKLGGTLSGGWKEKHKGFDNYTFEPTSGANYTGRVLYVGRPQEASLHQVKYKVRYPNGQEAISVFEK